MGPALCPIIFHLTTTWTTAPADWHLSLSKFPVCFFGHRFPLFNQYIITTHRPPFTICSYCHLSNLNYKLPSLLFHLHFIVSLLSLRLSSSISRVSLPSISIMMHNRCSSSHNMVGPCSCGLFHTQSNSSLSMLFSSMPNSVHKPTADENSDPYSYAYPNSYAYPYPYSAATSVDCTLSLGTPSTRMSEESPVDGDGRRNRGGGHERRSSISNFCWDILGQSKNAPSSQSHKATARGGGSNSSSGSSSCSGDPLLARRCANCDTTSTPLWRNGPRGPKVYLLHRYISK